MGYKILVVDDDRAILELVADQLEREGFDIMTAVDGDDALNKMKTDLPDIVLLDLIMPKLNGFEVLREIRKSYQEKWIPVIILSGQEDLASVQKSYALEADHYLTKPCDTQHILQGIQTMISLMKARKSKTE